MEVVTWEVKNRITYIQIEGDIFAVASAELKNAFQSSWEKKIYRIVIDLGKSNLINSSGIGIIVGALKSCREVATDGEIGRASGRERV